MTTNATVKFAPGEPRDTKNGPKINALVVLQSGEEVRIWGNPGEQPLASWTKGQQVLLEQKGQYWNIAKGQPSTPATAQPAAPSVGRAAIEVARFDINNDEARNAMYQRAREMADLYKHIHERLAKGDPDDVLDLYNLPESDLQPATATIFIQLMRGNG